MKIGIWKEDCNPLFAKYSQQLLLQTIQWLSELLLSEADDTVKLAASEGLVNIAECLSLLISESIDILTKSDKLMDTMWEIVQRIDLDAPRIAILRLFQRLFHTSEMQHSTTKTLSAKLHWLVTVSSPEVSVMCLGNGKQLQGPVVKSSIAVRAQAASCLRCLASHDGCDNLLLSTTFGRLIDEKDEKPPHTWPA